MVGIAAAAAVAAAAAITVTTSGADSSPRRGGLYAAIAGTEWRAIDGRNNNQNNRTWGMANTPYSRVAPANFADGKGNATTPPANQIANPNPLKGSTNKYTADNNFTNCSNFSQPGVAPIVNYIESLPYRAEPNCATAHYYMLDNTNPGFFPNGFQAPAPDKQSMLPASPVRTIGDSLNDKKITWAYFGGGYNDAVVLSNEAVASGAAMTLNSSTALGAAALADPAHELGVAYCQICNPFQYASSIMGDAAQRAAHIKDTVDLLSSIKSNTLPAVSFGKPDGLLDGHPSSSKIDLFEAYVQQVLDALEANPKLTPGAVKNILISTADRISNEPAIRQGYGAVNARRAVELAKKEHHALNTVGCSPPRVTDGHLVFVYHDDTARSVSLAGDFNGWNEAAHSLMKDPSGLWLVRIKTPAVGSYQYKFVVDGKRWAEDPSNGMKVSDGYGALNSLLVIE